MTGTIGEFIKWMWRMRSRAVAPEKAAGRTIEETQIVRLSVEDQRAFAEAILNPPEPAPALRRAFRRHRELIKESAAFDHELTGDPK